MSKAPFLPFRIGNLELKNRFMMSAAVDGLAADPKARAQRYAALAEGGVGLIVAGRVLDKNEEFGRVAEAVHSSGGRIALQLVSHMGIGFEPNVDSPAASVVPEASREHLLSIRIQLPELSESIYSLTLNPIKNIR